MDTLATNERPAGELAKPTEPVARNEELRKLAIRRLEHIRRFKLYLSVYVLSLVVLTPVWAITQYESQDGWPEHLSTRSRYPGDWDPWIIWVALVGGVVVAVAGLRAYWLDREITEADIEHEVERLRSR